MYKKAAVLDKRRTKTRAYTFCSFLTAPQPLKTIHSDASFISNAIAISSMDKYRLVYELQDRLLWKVVNHNV